MAFYLGDIPVEDIVIEPARDGQPLNLGSYDAGSVVVKSPSAAIDASGFTVALDPDDDTVSVLWPGDVPLNAAGVWELDVTLTATNGKHERLAPVYVIVQGDDGWYSLDAARADWRDAPQDDGRLFQLLELAKQQVVEYGPALAADAPVPVNFKAAQLMQARNLWNAGLIDPSTGAQGEDDSFQLKAFPLDWIVRQVIRPKSAVPVIR